MSKSTTDFNQLLSTLTEKARAMGLNDTEWSKRAGLRKETLSRLRGRTTCDLETLVSLAHVLGARLGLQQAATFPVSASVHFPDQVDRDYEEKLVDLCVSGDLSLDRWAQMGPLFFMAGLAVMLASVTGFDRRALLALSEALHPGASEPEVFARWLERSPVRPSRFLPLVDQRRKHAA